MANQKIERVFVIGGGQAGGEAAQRLRAADPRLEITLFAEEPHPPYQRPPLSKKFLAGEWAADRLPLRPREIYEEERIQLVLSRRATWIDRTNKRLRVEGGQELPYDAIILATGARPRRLPLPGSDLLGVHVLRTIADVEAIKADWRPGARLVVIGAGYIGLEVAAVARAHELDVTVLEAAPRPLSRVASPELSAFYLEEHVSRGVKFELGVKPAVFKGSDRVRAIGLDDGREIPADLVIVGIGVTPETALAERSGLAVDNGVLVDAEARTSDPAIFAIGDCARRPMPLFGGRMERLESVYNAIEGAKIASAAILGVSPTAPETPWNWSDQYDLKLQSAGLFTGYDGLVLRGDPKERSFAAFYFQGDRLIAVDAVNRPAEFLGAKMLIQKGRSPTPAMLQDLSRPMKDIVAAL